MNSNDWYNENIVKSRKTLRSKCCNASIEDAGSCFDGCCDKWQCTKCKKTWLVEVGD